MIDFLSDHALAFCLAILFGYACFVAGLLVNDWIEDDADDDEEDDGGDDWSVPDFPPSDWTKESV